MDQTISKSKDFIGLVELAKSKMLELTEATDYVGFGMFLSKLTKIGVAPPHIKLVDF
jgi:hypothetical protein